jgi:hypothetical protein
MRIAFCLVALLVAPALSGCTDFFDRLNRPDYDVSRTQLAGPEGWNRVPTFSVEVNVSTPVAVRIVATPPGDLPLATSGFSAMGQRVSLDLPDGTWTVTYYIDGHKWETFPNERFDSTPPELSGLESLGQAPEGIYVVGSEAVVEAGARLDVIDQGTGRVVATSLPATLGPLADGVHAFDIVLTDQAGNQALWTLQVVAGKATELPRGQFTAGIVARYTTTLRLWDLSDLGAYMSPADAAQQAPDYLGSGTALKPNDPAVQAVVADVVRPGMSSGEAALALYEWMHRNLDYLFEDLDRDDLLDPAQTMERGGGVCRDLAALYVSLLRGAGIPARLVAGYLAGQVNGFHAWVEFYGGEGFGPSPWVPVDVSTLNGNDARLSAIQAFGIRLPEHLGLRALTPPQEQGDWSSAARLASSAPPGAGMPDASFEKDLQDVRPAVRQVLCISLATLVRHLATTASQCTTPQRTHLPDFVVQAQRVLDYGITIESMPRGSHVQLTLVYPDPSDATVDSYAYVTRSDAGGLQTQGFREDAATGRTTIDLRR